MRTVTNYFLLTLAIADLTMASLNGAPNFVYMLLQYVLHDGFHLSACQLCIPFQLITMYGVKVNRKFLTRQLPLPHIPAQMLTDRLKYYSFFCFVS